MEAVDQWTQTTFLAIDPATRFLTTMNATQQTTNGGYNTTTALSTTFTYNSNKQLTKKETVATGTVSAVSATFEYDAQVPDNQNHHHHLSYPYISGQRHGLTRVFIVISVTCRGVWQRCQAQAVPPRMFGTPRRATPQACLSLTTQLCESGGDLLQLID
jgi:hypothetical protein